MPDIVLLGGSMNITSFDLYNTLLGRLNGRKFHEAQGSLACCSPWGQKESDMT